MNRKIVKKRLVLKKNIRQFLIRCMLTVIIVLITLIAIKTNNELIDYINEHLKVKPNSNIDKFIQKRKPNLIGTSVENDVKVKVYDNGMRVIEMKNVKEA